MPRKNSADLIHTIIKETLVSQQTQKSTLESKAGTLTAFAGGMLALLISAKDEILSLQLDARMLVVLCIILFSLSIVLSTIVGWVRKYRSDPNPEALIENYLNISEADLKLQLISNYLGVWKNNARRIEKNAILLKIALVAQTLAFLLLGAVLVFFLV